MPSTLMEAHLPDGELVRLLDGELEAGERTRAEEHIVECPECRARLHTLKRRSTRLTALLSESDWEAPPMPRVEAKLREIEHTREPRAAARESRTPWLRAAAIIAVLLGAGLFATPLPATIASWVAEQWVELTSPRLTAPTSVGETVSVQEAGQTRVQFAPEGAELTLEFATRQAGGAVTLRSADVELVSAAVVSSGGAGADLLVLPAGLRIQNTAGSTAEYTVVVPRRVRGVRVRIGDGDPIMLTAAELADGVQLDLRPGMR